MPEISGVIWVFHKCNDVTLFLTDAGKHLWAHRVDYFQPFDDADAEAMVILREVCR